VLQTGEGGREGGTAGGGPSEAWSSGRWRCRRRSSVAAWEGVADHIWAVASTNPGWGRWGGEVVRRARVGMWEEGEGPSRALPKNR